MFAFLWGPVNQASAVFTLVAAGMRWSKIRSGKFEYFISMVGGIFIFDFAMGKFYVSPTPINSVALLVGSILILALVCIFIPITGKLNNEGFQYVLLNCIGMGFTLFFYGIIYGGITPGVSDGPKLAAIVSIIFIKAKKEEELDVLWYVLLVMGILGNFIIPFIPSAGILGETF